MKNKAITIKLRKVEIAKVSEESFSLTFLLIVIQLEEKYMTELVEGKDTLHSLFIHDAKLNSVPPGKTSGRCPCHHQ